MVDRRRLVGNEIRSGSRKLRPSRQSSHYVLQEHAIALQQRRQRMIALTARPPAVPLPPPIQNNADNVTFNQLAYTVLLVAIMASISIATSFINWAFLVYAVLAVIVRLPSRLIFTSALICLVIIVIASSLSRSNFVNGFAVMTFYYMAIGLIRAILELRRENRSKSYKTPGSLKAR